MRYLSLFSGVGGGDLAAQHLLGWRCVGYVEWDDYCQRVLRQRQLDGCLDTAPIFGDIRTFLSEGWAEQYQGLVDVVTGGPPCQPFSVAGKRKGKDDERNMWPATIECICAVRPRFCLLENVPGLLTGGYFGTIHGQMAESGYDANWRCLSAAEVGAPHKRDRLWIVGHTEPLGCGGQPRGRTGALAAHGHCGMEEGAERVMWPTPCLPGNGGNYGKKKLKLMLADKSIWPTPRANDAEKRGNIANDPRNGLPSAVLYPTPTSITDSGGLAMCKWGGSGARKQLKKIVSSEEMNGSLNPDWVEWLMGWPMGWSTLKPITRKSVRKWRGWARHGLWWQEERGLPRVARNVKDRVSRLKGIGNGQVPAVAATAWALLTEGME